MLTLSRPATTRDHGPDVHTNGRPRVDFNRRHLQIALGILWLLDGALQLQPSMFTPTFATATLAANAAGQPAFLAQPILWTAHLIGAHPAIWNPFFASTQLLVGLGLLIPRTAKPALAASVIWAGAVWWLGEGLGMIPTGAASPLTGAPGAVILYAIIAAAAWTGPHANRALPGGLVRVMWVALWSGMAALWLLPANRKTSSVHDSIAAAANGEPHWIRAMLDPAANATRGHGAAIALALAAVSTLIGILGVSNRTAPWSTLGAGFVAGAYWVFGQAFGGIVTGQATDLNSGPLLLLFAVTFTASSAQQQQQSRLAEEAAQGAALKLRKGDASLVGTCEQIRQQPTG